MSDHLDELKTSILALQNQLDAANRRNGKLIHDAEESNARRERAEAALTASQSRVTEVEKERDEARKQRSKLYRKIEGQFLAEADRLGKTPRELDAMIWEKGSGYSEPTPDDSPDEEADLRAEKQHTERFLNGGER